MTAAQAAVPADSGGLAAWARAWLRAAADRTARWNRTAAAKADGAPIGPAERVLTRACSGSGAPVLASTAAIYFQNPAAPGRTWSRLPWEDIIGVGWDGGRRVLTLTGAGPAGLWREHLALPTASSLADVARERVTWTLLASTTVRLGGRACAVVTARRRPGSGTIVWVIVFNGAEDTGDPAIRAAVATAIAELQAQTGIPAGERAHAGLPLRRPRRGDPGRHRAASHRRHRRARIGHLGRARHPRSPGGHASSDRRADAGTTGGHEPAAPARQRARGGS